MRAWINKYYWHLTLAAIIWMPIAAVPFTAWLGPEDEPLVDNIVAALHKDLPGTLFGLLVCAAIVFGPFAVLGFFTGTDEHTKGGKS